MADDGKGGGDGKGAAGEEAQQLTTLKAELETLKGEHETSKAAKEDLERKLEEADKELLSENYLTFKEDKGKELGGGGDGAGKEGDIDFDRASNKEIVEFMEHKHKGNLKAAVEDMAKRVEDAGKATQMALAHVDVQMTAMRHDGKDGKPTFTENQKAILEIAKTNPSWNAEKCYQQFVLEGKAKADEEQEKKDKEAEEDNRALSEKGGVPASVTQEKELTAEEAADKAYRAAFGSEK